MCRLRIWLKRSESPEIKNDFPQPFKMLKRRGGVRVSCLDRTVEAQLPASLLRAQEDCGGEAQTKEGLLSL